MSAKPRKKGPKVDFDYFPTPPWPIDRLLDRHAGQLFRRNTIPCVLEPNVGDGAIVRAAQAWLNRVHGPPVYWIGVELRRGALDPRTKLAEHDEGVDFRTWEPGDRNGPRGMFDLALGNPPFSLAEAIIRRCFEVSRATCMLLRLGMLGSAERVPFWQGVGADPYIRVIPEHISFDGDGTDSSTYAWYVWGAELSGPRVDVLDTTPASVRAAQKPALPTGIPQLGFDI